MMWKGGNKCRGISSGGVCFFYYYYYKIQTSFVSESGGEKKAREKEREGEEEGEQEIGRCVISYLEFFVLLHANNSVLGCRHFIF